MNQSEKQSTFSRQWVGKILGSSHQSSKQPSDYSEISTDSRTLTTSALFAAIKGENFDGEQFIDSAIEAGAKGILCSRECVTRISKKHPGIDFYVSKSGAVDSLRTLAKAWREKINPTVIAVTGSVGKTTTKDLITSILRHNGLNTLSTDKSENGFLGIAKTLLRLRPEQTYAVIEIGIDDIGAMKEHLEIVRPDYSILTAIAEEHLHQLKDMETVAKEELLSLTWTFDHGGTVFVNMTDSRIAAVQFSDADPDRIIRFGHVGSKANYELFEKTSTNTFDVKFGKNVSTFDSSLRGPHNLINQLGAIAVTHKIGASPQIIREAIGAFKPSFGRTVIESHGEIQYVCDFYNANPASVKAALDTVDELTTKTSRIWVCLGDMLELGTFEEELHRSLASFLIRKNVSGVYLHGTRMLNLLDELKQKNFNGTLEHSMDKSRLAKHMKTKLKAGDVVLLKGSRGMKMEDILEHLT